MADFREARRNDETAPGVEIMEGTVAAVLAPAFAVFAARV